MRERLAVIRSQPAPPPAMPRTPEVVRPSSWRRAWPLPVSLLLHAAALGGALLSWPASPPPPPPQIELLPPAPVPPMPEEAAPSPVAAPPKPVPAFPRLAPTPLPRLALRPLATVNPRAEGTIPVAAPKPPAAKPVITPSPTPAADDRTSPASEAARAPDSGARTAATAVLGDPSPSPRPAGPPPGYLGLLRARLEKVKRYPPAARAAGQEGTVLLAFVLERDGQVSSWRIAGPSGVSSLDDEAAEMIQQAAFPPFPDSLDQADLHITVPVEFSLKDLK